MTTIYCFSGSGHSFAVAKALSQMLSCEIRHISFLTEATPGDRVAVVVFPVYCQNIPEPVKDFLKKLAAKQIVLIATYGKISYGNVLYEAQKLVSGEVIAGAYIPMGHTFLNGDTTFDTSYLQAIADRINTPRKVCIPKTRKNPLSNVFPGLRSRIGVKIHRNNTCTGCGLCEKMCPMGAIQNGQPNSKCIRCLRCVTGCPQQALQYENSRILNQYLKSYCKEEYILY